MSNFADIAANCDTNRLPSGRDYYRLLAAFWRDRLFMPPMYRNQPNAWCSDMEPITDCDKEQHKRIVELMQLAVEAKGYSDSLFQRQALELAEYLVSVVDSELHDRLRNEYAWVRADATQEISQEWLDDYQQRLRDHKATA